MQAWPIPSHPDRTGKRPGVILSVLLHGMLLLLAIGYLHNRPAITQTSLRALPVDLVIGGGAGQAVSTAPAARLQIARPHPESAPVPEGTNPKGTKQPEDELSARLRALAQLKTPDAALPNADNSAAPGGGIGDDSGEGNYALKDFIRAQILRRWLPDLSTPGTRNMPVLLRIRLLKSGVIDDVAIVDQQRFHVDKIFHEMALSARDAALLASPIQIPGVHFQKTQTLTIDLDPKAVLR